MRRLGTGMMLAALMAASACHRGHTGGQVVATVNGEEVTLQELNTELQSANVPQGVDKSKAQRALLQRVVERKLLVDLATKKGLATSPDYLAQKRRTDETLLAQIYARQQLAAVPVPTAADIGTFMKDNPGAFADRQQLMLDQIRFPQPANPESLKGIEAVHSMDGVAAFLTQRGLKFVRTPASLDSASVPAPLLTQITRLPAGEPFVIPTGPTLTVNIITGRRPITNDAAQAQQAATGAWRQQKVQQMILDQLKTARNDAKITYQPGFEPPATPGAPIKAKP